jgi:hypothetical protein
MCSVPRRATTKDWQLLHLLLVRDGQMPTGSTKARSQHGYSRGHKGAMTRKRPGWRKDWSRDGDRLIHASGAQFLVAAGAGYTTVNFVEETLPEFHAFEQARGTPGYAIGQRLLDLIAEADDWLALP